MRVSGAAAAHTHTEIEQELDLLRDRIGGMVGPDAPAPECGAA